MLDCNVSPTPLPISPDLRRILTPATGDDKGWCNYRSVVCEALFIARATDPALSHGCSVLARFQDDPRALHFFYLKKFCRYIKGRFNSGLFYSRNKVKTKKEVVLESKGWRPGFVDEKGLDADTGRRPVVEKEIVGISDADFAYCPNTRRSQTGYMGFVLGNLYTWGSFRQGCVSTSTMLRLKRTTRSCVRRFTSGGSMMN